MVLVFCCSMKKWFTLIELVITIVIIGVVLSMVTGLGNWFSDRIRFANTKEVVTQSLQNIVQEAATTNAVRIGTGWVRYGMLSFFIPVWSGALISWTYSTWDLSTAFSGTKRIEHGILITSWFSRSITPYEIGCRLWTGDRFRLVSTDDTKLQACFRMQASTCKLQEISCP